jgi:hypothetical protein
MLPFMWSEDGSCDGAPKPLVSGVEILFGPRFTNPTPGIVFFALLAIAIGLGFAAARTARPWWKVVAAVVASAATTCTTLMCSMMMMHGRADQPLDHPAAWVGSFVSFGMMLEAWFASGGALHGGVLALRTWRARRLLAQERREGRAPPPAQGVRVAAWPTSEAEVDPGEGVDEADELAEPVPAPAVRRVRR